MATNLSQECPEGEDPFECPDNLIYWAPQFDEYGLIIHDGGASYLVIGRCPWCGATLPESKRDMWLSELQARGFSNPLTDEVPVPYTTDEWYRASGERS
jgi:uncharacterized protein DUF6980